MAAVPELAQELRAALSLSGNNCPNKVAEALSVLLRLLPLYLRARMASVCRAWRQAASHSALWQELSFEGCTARITNAALASLCARAGAGLRVLLLDAAACCRVTAAGMLAALRDGGCTGVRRLSAPAIHSPDELVEAYASTACVHQLAATCPLLEHAACAVRCSLSQVAAASLALPGPLAFFCAEHDIGGFGSDDSHDTHMVGLAECLRGNATITSLGLPAQLLAYRSSFFQPFLDALRVNTALLTLDLSNNFFNDAGATQLAACLHANATLREVNLSSNDIGVAGATKLAECLRSNTALTSLDLGCNRIGDAGATQLAECLHSNAALANLILSSNSIGNAGATQLAGCLRNNATLTRLDLVMNDISAESAGHLAECLHANATLTELILSCNDGIGDAGATQLAESLRFNATLKSLHLAA
jgi:hypothetical protein